MQVVTAQDLFIWRRPPFCFLGRAMQILLGETLGQTSYDGARRRLRRDC